MSSKRFGPKWILSALVISLSGLTWVVLKPVYPHQDPISANYLLASTDVHVLVDFSEALSIKDPQFALPKGRITSAWLEDAKAKYSKIYGYHGSDTLSLIGKRRLSYEVTNEASQKPWRLIDPDLVVLKVDAGRTETMWFSKRGRMVRRANHQTEFDKVLSRIQFYLSPL